MRKGIIYLFISLIALSCEPWGNEFPQQHTRYIPLAITRSQLESSFKVEAPKAIVNAGKIYSYQNYLLVNEKYEGIHIIDNSNPKNPIKLAFLNIIGNVDLSIRNGILYADNSVDLLSIDLNADEPTVVNRAKKVFKQPLPPDNLPIPEKYLENNEDGEEIIIVKWVLPTE